jgi:hypothetical protein
MHPRAALVAVVGAALLPCRVVVAQPRPQETLRLDVTRDARSASCPDRERLRALLVARLARDPVADDAARGATLRFVRGRAHFEARLRITGPGRSVTTRRLRSSATDCAHLGDAASLVLALAIDPLLALRRREPVAVPVAPTPPPASPEPPAPTPVAPPAAPVAPAPQPPPRAPAATTSWQVGALATMTGGVAPGLFADLLRPGIALRVSPARGRWALPLELSVDVPGRFDDTARGAHVAVLPVRVGVGGCARFGARLVLTACATLSAGAVFAWGTGYAPDRSDAALVAALGARAGLEAPLSPRWRFVASLDAMALVVRPAFEVAGNTGGTLWTASPLAVSLAAGVAWQNH